MNFDYTLHYCMNIGVLTTLSVFCFVYYYDFMLIHPDEAFSSTLTSKISSSVWCQTTQNGDKICTLKNVCLEPSAGFLFILNERSQVFGIENLNDLLKIKTSSLTNHSMYYLKLHVVKEIPEAHFITRKFFAMARFKPDNIHHVIHDDLLPLYYRYNQICLGNVAKCSSRYQLLFIDEYDTSYFADWYKAFSEITPLSLTKFDKSEPVCFKELTLGLGEETIFYQYGFGQPHGPVKPSIYGQVVTNFKDYILRALNIKKNQPVSTLLLRKQNRKILNEDYLLKTVRRFTDLKKVVQIDVSTNSTSELLSTISSSNFLLGMHGGGMILSLFLPPNAKVVELFPFGIQKHVSPINSLLSMKGLKFYYFSWTNLNESNTVTHPEYPINLGGLQDLSLSEKLKIENNKLVEPVQCCNNRAYLYRMYQDTYVDETIETVISDAFNNFQNQTLFENFYFPSQVRNLNCTKNNNLVITWDPPYNIMHYSPVYKVAIKTYKSSFTINTAETKIIRENIDVNIEHQIWVLCFANNIPSLDSYITC